MRAEEPWAEMQAERRRGKETRTEEMSPRKMKVEEMRA
jgi:hypothetical protein